MEPSSEGAKALKIVGIVVAILVALGAVCCGGAYLIGDSIVDEVNEAFGPLHVGSGVVAEQKRLVTGFTGVRLDAVADVTVRQGDAFDVTIRADDNLLPLVATEVVDGVLVISARERWDSKTGIEIAVVAPDIDLLEASGVGDVTASDLDLDSLRVVVRGVGSVEASGRVGDLDVQVDGVGDALLADLVAARVTVRVSGVGDAEVHALEKLAATVSGVGDVRYRGDPPDLTKQEDGVGDVVPVR